MEYKIVKDKLVLRKEDGVNFALTEREVLDLMSILSSTEIVEFIRGCSDNDRASPLQGVG